MAAAASKHGGDGGGRMSQGQLSHVRFEEVSEAVVAMTVGGVQ